MYKAYLLELEKGKRYHIEMSLGKTPTSLAVFDPNADSVAKQIAKTNANVTWISNQTGMHRILVAAPLPPDRAKYTLRVTTVP